VRWPAVSVSAVIGIERRQLHRSDRRDHEPRELILGSHSSKLGGSKNACSRSHPKKFRDTPASS
jgi:hypothetical protein